MSDTVPPLPAAAAPPPPAPPPPAGRVDEFSDRLSPMVVKELRQGLRSKIFITLFLVMQGLLCIVLLFTLAVNRPESAGPVISRTIFLFFSLAVLVAQPLRGIGAIHQEIKGDTIDLMVLTRLGSWGIVLGKWVSIVSQSALLFVTVIPYLILRYFFGGMELFAELLMLGLVFAGSAAITAATVALSAHPSIIIRGLIPIAGGFWLTGVVFEAIGRRQFDGMVEFCQLQSSTNFWLLLTFVLAGIYFSWTGLSLAATAIAPRAENHATPRRFAALAAFTLVAVAAHLASFDEKETIMVLSLVVIPAVIGALTEVADPLPPMCRRFLRFGAAGRLAGRLLYPGWPPGVLFSGLIMGLTGVIVAVKLQSSTGGGWISREEVAGFLTITGTFLMPALLVNLLGERVKNRFGSYILIAMLLIAVAVICELASNASPNGTAVWQWALCWVPPVQANLFGLVSSQHFADGHSGDPDFTAVSVAGAVTAGLCYLGLLVGAVRNFALYRQAETEALQPAASPNHDA